MKKNTKKSSGKKNNKADEVQVNALAEIYRNADYPWWFVLIITLELVLILLTPLLAKALA